MQVHQSAQIMTMEEGSPGLSHRIDKGKKPVRHPPLAANGLQAPSGPLFPGYNSAYRQNAPFQYQQASRGFQNTAGQRTGSQTINHTSFSNAPAHGRVVSSPPRLPPSLRSMSSANTHVSPGHDISPTRNRQRLGSGSSILGNQFAQEIHRQSMAQLHADAGQLGHPQSQMSAYPDTQTSQPFQSLPEISHEVRRVIRDANVPSHSPGMLRPPPPPLSRHGFRNSFQSSNQEIGQPSLPTRNRHIAYSPAPPNTLSTSIPTTDYPPQQYEDPFANNQALSGNLWNSGRVKQMGQLFDRRGTWSSSPARQAQHSSQTVRHPVYGWQNVPVAVQLEDMQINSFLNPHRQQVFDEMKQQGQLNAPDNEMHALAICHTRAKDQLDQAPRPQINTGELEEQSVIEAMVVREIRYRNFATIQNTFNEHLLSHSFSGSAADYRLLNELIARRKSTLALRIQKSVEVVAKRQYLCYMGQHGLGPAAEEVLMLMNTDRPQLDPTTNTDPQEGKAEASEPQVDADLSQEGGSGSESTIDDSLKKGPIQPHSSSPPDPSTPQRLSAQRQGDRSGQSSHNSLARRAMKQNRVMSSDQGHGSSSSAASTTHSVSDPTLGTPTRPRRRVSQGSLGRGMLDEFNAQADESDNINGGGDQSFGVFDPSPTDALSVPLPSDDSLAFQEQVDFDLLDWDQGINWDILNLNSSPSSTSQAVIANTHTEWQASKAAEALEASGTPSQQTPSSHIHTASATTPASQEVRTPSSGRKRPLTTDESGGDESRESESAKRQRLTPTTTESSNPPIDESLPELGGDWNTDEPILPDWFNEYVSNMDQEE